MIDISKLYAVLCQEMMMQYARIEEKAEAIPAEDRTLYEIRERRHIDGTRTLSLEHKDAPFLPCRCSRCES